MIKELDQRAKAAQPSSPVLPSTMFVARGNRDGKPEMPSCTTGSPGLSPQPFAFSQMVLEPIRFGVGLGLVMGYVGQRLTPGSYLRGGAGAGAAQARRQRRGGPRMQRGYFTCANSGVSYVSMYNTYIYIYISPIHGSKLLPGAKFKGSAGRTDFARPLRLYGPSELHRPWALNHEARDHIGLDETDVKWRCLLSTQERRSRGWQ